MKLTPQAQRTLELLKRGRLTRLIALHYGIANLPARILDLRRAGYGVYCDFKRDADGRRYGEFYLSAAGMILTSRDI